jgi:sigma-E factor negative regulatory protein RseC
MMSETGRVVAVDAEAVWVETERRGTCGSCAARSGCGHGLLASMGRDSTLVRALLAPGGPQAVALHDEVRISIPERGFLRGVAIMYLMPLLTMVGAALLSNQWAASAALSQAQIDLRVTLGALAGLALGLFLLRIFERRNAADPTLNPVVTNRL